MKKIFIILIICCLTTTAHGKPTVTNVVNSGSAHTITGTDFGINTSPAPVISDNFSDGVVDSAISGGWTWHTGGAPYQTPVYKDDTPRVTGGKYIHLNYTDPYTGGFFFPTNETSEKPVVYTSFYMRVSKIGSPTVTNAKYMFFTSSSNNFTGSLPRLTFIGNSTLPAEPGAALALQWDGDIPGEITARESFIDEDILNQGWLRYEMYGKESSGGATKDGIVVITKQEGASKHTEQIVNEWNPGEYLDACITRDTGHWVNAFYGLFAGDGQAGWSYQYEFSNIYFSESFSRVEIHNRANRNESEIIETQAMTAHSTTGITTIIDWGALDSEITNYMTVYDDSGVASDSFILLASDSPTVALQADKEATSPTSYTGTASATTGKTITGVVSSNGFTVTPDDGTWDEQVEAFTVTSVTVPITDICTATDSESDTGFDSITITLLEPASTAKKCVLKKASLN